MPDNSHENNSNDIAQFLMFPQGLKNDKHILLS